MTIMILPIGSDILMFTSAMKKLNFQLRELDVEIHRPLQTMLEVENALANQKPSIVLLDRYIIKEKGLCSSSQDVIEVLERCGYRGPIIAWSDSTQDNFDLMGLGASHRCDRDSKRARKENVTIDERVKWTKTIVERHNGIQLCNL